MTYTVPHDKMADELLEQQREPKAAKPAPDPRFTGYSGRVVRETHGGSPKKLLVGGPIQLPLVLADGSTIDAALLRRGPLQRELKRLGISFRPDAGKDDMLAAYAAHLEAEAAQFDPKPGQALHESMKIARQRNG